MTNIWHSIIFHFLTIFTIICELNAARTKLTQRNNHENISELLDNLLRGYDNSVRPDFGGKHKYQFKNPNPYRHS